MQGPIKLNFLWQSDNWKYGVGSPNAGGVYGEPGWVYQDMTPGNGKFWLCSILGLNNWLLLATAGTGGNNGYATDANNAGNTTVTPTTPNQVEVIAVGGAARTSVVILDVVGRSQGDRLALNFNLPATAAIILEIRNATAGGTLLLPVESYPAQNLTTDGVIRSWTLQFVFDGAAWLYLSSKLPA